MKTRSLMFAVIILISTIVIFNSSIAKADIRVYDKNNQYLGKNIKITGIIASWGYDDDLLPILTLISDSFGNDRILCSWFQHFNEDGMIDIIGKEIVLLGVCDGLVGDILCFHNCSSEIIPTETPIEDLD